MYKLTTLTFHSGFMVAGWFLFLYWILYFIELRQEKIFTPLNSNIYQTPPPQHEFLTLNKY